MPFFLPLSQSVFLSFYLPNEMLVAISDDSLRKTVRNNKKKNNWDYCYAPGNMCITDRGSCLVFD